MRDFPLVVENDDGIRPAGKPDACFYCNQVVGTPHLKDCVAVKKTVKVKYIIEIEKEVPHFWDKEQVEFQLNHGTWCSDNAIGELEEHAKKHGCLCNDFEGVYLETVDDTPKRGVADDL